MHDFSQSVPVCAVFDLLCKGAVESVPEGAGSVRDKVVHIIGVVRKFYKNAFGGLSLFESPSIKIRYGFSTNIPVCLSQEVFLREC